MKYYKNGNKNSNEYYVVAKDGSFKWYHVYDPSKPEDKAYTGEWFNGGSEVFNERLMKKYSVIELTEEQFNRELFVHCL